MAEKDATEKTLESYADVFADIVNVLLFNGQRLIDPSDLRDALPRSIYKADGKLHEQERDTAKFWMSPQGLETPRGNIRIAFIGLENQTEPDEDITLRVIGYDGAAYRDQPNHDKAGKPKERYPVVTLVLYFGYEKRWDKPLSLKDRFDIPKELEPYFNDYRVNLFEIAWLPDETAAMFQSDFRFVADYLIRKRKNRRHKPLEGEADHVREVMELLSAVMQDTRFMDAYNKRIEEGRRWNMDAWIDEAESRGREEGREEGRAEAVRNLMKTMHMTAEDAMNALLVPAEARKQLMTLI